MARRYLYDGDVSKVRRRQLRIKIEEKKQDEEEDLLDAEEDPDEELYKDAGKKEETVSK